MIEINGIITQIIKPDELSDYAVPSILHTPDKDVIIIKTGEPKSIIDKISYFFGLSDKFSKTIISDSSMLAVGEHASFTVQPLWVQSIYFTTDLGEYDEEK